MEQPVEDSVEIFFNLQGSTFVEKKRALNRLFQDVRKFSSENDAFLNRFSEELKSRPKTHLENVFYAEFLLNFRRFDDIWLEYLSGNAALTRKISNKDRWIFQKAFENLGEEFVKENFPKISYRMKLKLLNKMSLFLTEPQADTIFEALNENYGLALAKIVLPSCSLKKIKEFLSNSPEIKIRTRQAKILYKKDPQMFADLYFKSKIKEKDPILLYILQENSELLCQLLEEHKFPLRVGRKNTKKLITNHRETILEHPKLYLEKLKSDVLVKNLGQDFPEFFAKIFPRTLEGFNKNIEVCVKLLKFYDKQSRFGLFQNTYDSIFKVKFEQQEFSNSDFVYALIDDDVRRENLAKSKTPETDEIANTKYLRPENCFKLIKPKFNFARYPYERANLAKKLVENCLYQKNFEVFSQVMQYLTERLKNDHEQWRHEVLFAIGNEFSENTKLIDCLTENHWKMIKEVMIKSENMQYYQYSQMIPVFYGYLQFLIANNSDSVKGEILSFFETHIIRLDNWKKFPKCRKIILENLLDLAKDIEEKQKSLDKFAPVNLYLEIVKACEEYNKDNRRNKIQFYSNSKFLKAVKDFLSTSTDLETSSKLLESLICSAKTEEDLSNFMFLQFNNPPLTPNIVKTLSTFQPKVFYNNFEKIANYLEQNENSQKCLKNFVQVDSKVAQICADKNLAVSLSLITTLPQYLSWVKANFESCDTSLWQLKKFEIRNKEDFESLLEFLSSVSQKDCVDQEKLLGLLFSLFYKMPETWAESYINIFKNQETLLKKFSFASLSVIFGLKFSLGILNEYGSKRALVLILKIFIKNPAVKIWIILQNQLVQAGGSEVSSKFVARRVVEKIPEAYLGKYLEILWEIFEKSQNFHCTKLLLSRINNEKTISATDFEFFSKIVKADFLCDKLDSSADLFVCKYLIIRRSPENFPPVFEKLETCKNSKPKVKKFIKSFYEVYVKSPVCDENFIVNFLERFQNVFKPSELIQEFLTLSVMRFKNQSTENFSTSLRTLNKYLVDRFGTTCVEIFADVLKNLLYPDFFASFMDLFGMYYVFLTDPERTLEDVLLVIKLLPMNSEPQDKDIFELFDKVLKLMEDTNLEPVRMNLNLYFKHRQISSTVENYYYNSSGDLVYCG